MNYTKNYNHLTYDERAFIEIFKNYIFKKLKSLELEMCKKLFYQ